MSIADMELLDRIIRLGEVATSAPDDVRKQLALTLQYINCPAVLTVPLGGNIEAALTFARAAQKEEEVARRLLHDPLAEGLVTDSSEEPAGSPVMPATAERRVDGAARHGGPPPPPPVTLG